MRGDGAGLARITRSAGRDADPAWSPDGKWIAFDSDRGGAVSIFRMNADGSGILRLTNGADGSPSWSPDGTRIAFFREAGQGTELFLVDNDGRTLVQLTA